MRTFAAKLILLLGGVLAGEAVRAQAWQSTQIQANYRSAVVYLESEVTDATGGRETVTGTGFIVHRGGYVLTASHVVPPDELGQRRLSTRGRLSSRYSLTYQAVPLDVIGRLHDRDLVLLRFRGTEKMPNHIPVARGETLKVDLATVVFAVGFPQQEDLMVKEGRIDSLNADGGNWNTSAAITYGMSGGPVIDQRGIVVAVTKSGVLGAEALRYVTPITYARPLLDQAGVQYQDNAVVPSATLEAAFAPGAGRKLTSTVHAVSDLKTDHNALTPTSGAFSRTFRADPGKKFVAAHLVPRSQSNASDVEVKVAADGSAVEVLYRLTSGPVTDRYRGWMDAEVVTTQIAK